MPPKKKSDKKTTNTKQKQQGKGILKNGIIKDVELKSQDDVDSPDESDYLDSSGSISSDDYEEQNLDEVDNENAIDDNLEIDDEDEPEESDDGSGEDENDLDDIGEADDGIDECMYKFANKKNKKFLEDDNDFDDDFFDDDTPEILGDIYVENDQRISKPVLTKYERVRALGDRARQLASGAKPNIKDASHMNPKDLARLELKLKVMPFFIDRTLPSGKKERWDINELKVVE